MGRRMNTRIELNVTGVAHGGEALGRHAGKVVFVPYAAPGERVVVELVEERERWARARLLDVLQPSPLRVEPACPHFGDCKGCQLQHLSYPAQLEAKREVVRDQLMRLGHLQDVVVHDVIGMAAPWGYRNQAHLYAALDGRLGIKAGPEQVIAGIDGCLLFHPLLDELFDALDLDVEDLHRVTLRAGAQTEDQMLIFETLGNWTPELEADLPISCLLREGDDIQVLFGDEWFWDVVSGRPFRISALSPFPANTEMAQLGLALLRRYLSPTDRDVLLDAGSGVGVVGLSLVDELAGIVATEDNGWAVADFMANAGERSTAGIVQGPLFEGLTQIDASVDLAVVTPPRAGVGQESAQELARLDPRRVAYLAPDPAILARDVQHMQGAGYHLVEVQPFDMLPQTSQVYLIAIWDRQGART
jgi:23S rRNA (uracil1939-C5)-methyltransferase